MSWFDFWPRYKCGAIVSADMREVCRVSETLTFDHRSPAGFTEIEVMRGPAFVHRRVEVADTVQGAAKDLLAILGRALINGWDPNVHHTVFLSAGRDSRILMLLLRNAAQEGFALGDFKVISHEPEQRLVEKFIHETMPDFEFDYDPWRGGRPTDPDYYDIRFDLNTNAFNHPPICMFPEDLPDRSVMVTGLMGGELLEYPATKQSQVNLANGSYLGGLWYFIRDVAVMSAYVPFTWQGFLSPYLSSEYLNYAFSLPPHFFVYIEGQGDVLRREMLRQLGADLVPEWRGHTYNLKFSGRTMCRLGDEFRSSRFYRDHGYHHVIRENPPEMWTPSGGAGDFKAMALRLYGLATMYEGI